VNPKLAKIMARRTNLILIIKIKLKIPKILFRFSSVAHLTLKRKINPTPHP
jgi:hypothetical protein